MEDPYGTRELDEEGCYYLSPSTVDVDEDTQQQQPQRQQQQGLHHKKDEQLGPFSGPLSQFGQLGFTDEGAPIMTRQLLTKEQAERACEIALGSPRARAGGGNAVGDGLRKLPDAAGKNLEKGQAEVVAAVTALLSSLLKTTGTTANGYSKYASPGVDKVLRDIKNVLEQAENVSEKSMNRQRSSEQREAPVESLNHPIGSAQGEEEEARTPRGLTVHLHHRQEHVSEPRHPALIAPPLPSPRESSKLAEVRRTTKPLAKSISEESLSADSPKEQQGKESSTSHPFSHLLPEAFLYLHGRASQDSARMPRTLRSPVGQSRAASILELSGETPKFAKSTKSSLPILPRAVSNSPASPPETPSVVGKHHTHLFARQLSQRERTIAGESVSAVLLEQKSNSVSNASKDGGDLPPQEGWEFAVNAHLAHINGQELQQQKSRTQLQQSEQQKWLQQQGNDCTPQLAAVIPLSVSSSVPLPSPGPSSAPILAPSSTSLPPPSDPPLFPGIKKTPLHLDLSTIQALSGSSHSTDSPSPNPLSPSPLSSCGHPSSLSPWAQPQLAKGGGKLYPETAFSPWSRFTPSAFGPMTPQLLHPPFASPYHPNSLGWATTPKAYAYRTEQPRESTGGNQLLKSSNVFPPSSCPSDSNISALQTTSLQTTEQTFFPLPSLATSIKSGRLSPEGRIDEKDGNATPLASSEVSTFLPLNSAPPFYSSSCVTPTMGGENSAFTDRRRCLPQAGPTTPPGHPSTAANAAKKAGQKRRTVSSNSSRGDDGDEENNVRMSCNAELEAMTNTSVPGCQGYTSGEAAPKRARVISVAGA
eukprot:TRINITY_DN16941_c0_g1_i1.p1 TRINITY_DN16941_c0_g1~~TRINITY_DN16941_c0_g1_i1.p1  ORF type:complete len:898 (+),score=168.56 TRINITY_DN16941_c0_g1_i1:248-2695(+)